MTDLVSDLLDEAAHYREAARTARARARNTTYEPGREEWLRLASWFDERSKVKAEAARLADKAPRKGDSRATLRSEADEAYRDWSSRQGD